MRFLNEPIARRANREDECTGRFWEGRFKCQKLDDEGAALACMAYVDLNPVRAGVAETPEGSAFTSGQDRITALRARRQLAQAPIEPTRGQKPLFARASSESQRDHWLAAIGPQSTDEAGRDGSANGEAVEHIFDPPPLLSLITESEYLELLDWTGRELRSGKRGSIAHDLRPVLERLDLDVAAWVENVERYSGLFSRLVGKLSRLREAAQASGLHWFQGKPGARQLYTVEA